MEMVFVVIAAVTALMLIEGAKGAINRMSGVKLRAERRGDRPRR